MNREEFCEGPRRAGAGPIMLVEDSGSKPRREQGKVLERLERLNNLFDNFNGNALQNISGIVCAGREVLAGPVVKYSSLQRETVSICSKFGGREKFEVERNTCDFFIDASRWIGENPLYIYDLRSASDKIGDNDIEEYGLESLFAHPVRANDSTVGWLCYYDNKSSKFSREEIDLLDILSRAISVEEERWIGDKSFRDFIDLASHELLHPITIIKAYAISLKNLENRLDAETKSGILDCIDQGADRLVRLVNRLMQTARIDRGNYHIMKRESPLRPIVDQAILKMSDTVSRRIVCADFPGNTHTVFADSENLVKVLVILLENAANFSPEGTEIEIQVERRDEEIIVSVLDHGLGIPDESRKIVFNRFYQVEGTLHHSIPGMGLGLYIAKNILRLHGGRIWCESREEGGSIFSFSLNAAEDNE
jgi:signal transduction histidine kinase